MAGYDDRNGVPVIGHSHRAKGLRLANRARDIGVSARLAVRDGKQGMPAFQLEIGSAQVKGECEFAAFARKIFVEFEDEGCGSFGGLFPLIFGFLWREVVAIEFEGDQTFLGDSKIQGTDEGLHLRVAERFHGFSVGIDSIFELRKASGGET
jgi:hypothetical protein